MGFFKDLGNKISRTVKSTGRKIDDFVVQPALDVATPIKLAQTALPFLGGSSGLPLGSLTNLFQGGGGLSGFGGRLGQFGMSQLRSQLPHLANSAIGYGQNFLQDRFSFGSSNPWFNPAQSMGYHYNNGFSGLPMLASGQPRTARFPAIPRFPTGPRSGRPPMPGTRRSPDNTPFGFQDIMDKALDNFDSIFDVYLDARNREARPEPAPATGVRKSPQRTATMSTERSDNRRLVKKKRKKSAPSGVIVRTHRSHRGVR